MELYHTSTERIARSEKKRNGIISRVNGFVIDVNDIHMISIEEKITGSISVGLHWVVNMILLVMY